MRQFDQQVVESVALRRQRVRDAVYFGHHRWRRQLQDHIQPSVMGVVFVALIAAGCIAASFVVSLIGGPALSERTSLRQAYKARNFVRDLGAPDWKPNGAGPSPAYAGGNPGTHASHSSAVGTTPPRANDALTSPNPRSAKQFQDRAAYEAFIRESAERGIPQVEAHANQGAMASAHARSSGHSAAPGNHSGGSSAVTHEATAASHGSGFSHLPEHRGGGDNDAGAFLDEFGPTHPESGGSSGHGGSAPKGSPDDTGRGYLLGDDSNPNDIAELRRKSEWDDHQNHQFDQKVRGYEEPLREGELRFTDEYTRKHTRDKTIRHLSHDIKDPATRKGALDDLNVPDHVQKQIEADLADLEKSRVGGEIRASDYQAVIRDNLRHYDMDHKIDLQLGGSDSEDNLQFLDKSVNRSVGSQMNREMANKGFVTEPGSAPSRPIRGIRVHD